MNKLLLNAKYNTPTEDLLHQTGSLSIHQMVAYHTALTTYKIVKSGKPSYIAAKLKVRQGNQHTRQGAYTVSQQRYRLNMAREGFIYRGAMIFNKFDECLRKDSELQRFKNGVREWVKSNIHIRPQQLFPSISAGIQTNQPPPPPPEPPPQQPPRNTITRYLIPVSRSQPSTRPSSNPLYLRNQGGMRRIEHYFPPANPR